MKKKITILELINKMRREYFLTQKELAQKAGVDQVSICFYQSGKRVPSLRSIKKIVAAANELGMNIKYTDLAL